MFIWFMSSRKKHVTTASEYSPALSLFFRRRLSVYIFSICLCICLEPKYPILLFATHAKVEKCVQLQEKTAQKMVLCQPKSIYTLIDQKRQEDLNNCFIRVNVVPFETKLGTLGRSLEINFHMSYTL